MCATFRTLSSSSKYWQKDRSHQVLQELINGPYNHLHHELAEFTARDSVATQKSTVTATPFLGTTAILLENSQWKYSSISSRVGSNITCYICHSIENGEVTYLSNPDPVSRSLHQVSSQYTDPVHTHYYPAEAPNPPFAPLQSEAYYGANVNLSPMLATQPDGSYETEGETSASSYYQELQLTYQNAYNQTVQFTGRYGEYKKGNLTFLIDPTSSQEQQDYDLDTLLIAQIDSQKPTEHATTPISPTSTVAWLKVMREAIGTVINLDPGNPVLQPEVIKTTSLKEFRIEIRYTDGSNYTTVVPWNPAQDITDSNIAWIAAHTSVSDPSPRMPQLEFAIANLPIDLRIEAKLEVQYTRGNGTRSSRNQTEDTVLIPANGVFAQVTGNTWIIHADSAWQTELTQRGFFGGEATLTYRIYRGQTLLLSNKSLKFRIGGKNPDAARARTYIETLTNASAQGPLWFAYAIAKTESKDYNGTGTRYNQFWQLPQNQTDNDYRIARQTHAGRPVWGDDGNDEQNVPLPGGYGMFQVTGTASDPKDDIPRKQIWNWQENSRAALAILAAKRTIADNWMTEQKNSNNANGVVLPSLTVGNVIFEDGTTRTINNAVTMKAYNGASRSNFNFPDNGTVSGFTLDSHSAGHFCYWRSLRRVQTNNNDPNWENGTIQTVQNPTWTLSRLNSRNPPFIYVDRVCQEVE